MITGEKDLANWFLRIITGLAILASLSLGAYVVLNEFRDNTNLYVGDEFPLQLRLNPTKENFKKSEFVVIEVTAKNVSDFTVPIPWNTCGDVYELILDREHKFFDDDGPVCGIGGGISAGKEVYKTIELDLSHLETGKHVVSVTYGGRYQEHEKIKSNEIEIGLSPADHIYDCLNYTEDVTTLCHPVMIRSNNNSTFNENNAICEKIKNEFLAKSHPLVNPIPSLSTENCTQGEPAVFVFNLPNYSSDRFDYEIQNADKNDNVCRTTHYTRQSLLNSTQCF